jgi:hypothetical protein
MPLRDHFVGPGVQLTIRVTERDRAQLGANPGARAAAIVRAALAERRRKREKARAQAQLGLRLVPPRRRSSARSRPE